MFPADGGATWLCSAGTWSATAGAGCSLILTDTSNGMQQQLEGPGEQLMAHAV
jgi:hypothetical protein